MVRRSALWVAAVAALVPIGAACGGDDDSSDTTTTTAASASPSSTAAATTVTPTVLPVTTAALPISDAPGYAQEPPEGTLRQGMKGPRVQAMQAKLISLGYDPGVADGLFGAKTRAAVQRFQTDKGLVADGIVGPLTLAALAA